MSRILIGSMLGFLLGVFPVLGEEKDKPVAPGEKEEKIDGREDRSLTGFIEKVEAKDEKSGAFVLRIGKDLPRLTLQVNGETKILTEKNESLEAGLQSPLLIHAEVQVIFIDKKPKDEKQSDSDLHICRLVRLIKSAK